MRLLRPLLSIALVLVGTRLLAEGADVSQVDGVLDRLEKRLLDQEADGLTFAEKNAPPPSAAPGEKTTKYTYKKDKIEASVSEQEKLKALTAVIADLEGQVDQLASNVQKTKQSVLDDAKIDNFITVEAQLNDTDAAALKTLNIKLDGYPVYELHDASGLWLPSKSVPLYAGPLQPGAHRLDLEARLAVKHKEAIPLNADVYRFVNKSFEIQVPGGTTTPRYVITLVPPAKAGDDADATIKEAL